MAAPAPRIGKYAPGAGKVQPHPADSERQPRNAAWLMAQEMGGSKPRKPSRKVKARGLINR